MMTAARMTMATITIKSSRSVKPSCSLGYQLLNHFLAPASVSKYPISFLRPDMAVIISDTFRVCGSVCDVTIAIFQNGMVVRARMPTILASTVWLPISRMSAKIITGLSSLTSLRMNVIARSSVRCSDVLV